MHDAQLDTSGKAEAACETACIALAPPRPSFPPIVFSFSVPFHWWLFSLSLSLHNACVFLLMI